MLKASDLARVAIDRNKTNHDTYKMILTQCYECIKRCNNMFIYRTQYAVPEKWAGRPPFKHMHAVRYVSTKLQRGGFAVVPLMPHDHVLNISWYVAGKAR